MSRDQIAQIFFKDLKNPITSTNFVLKRLRREKYIEANTTLQPYVYFPAPSLIKTNSQKLNHYLAIVNFYIDVCKYQQPTIFEVEKRYGPTFMQPDIYMLWDKKEFFVEIQISRYSSAIMEEKLNRYRNYYNSQKWISRSDTLFPYIWIISKISYPIQCNKLHIIQTPSVSKYLQK
ncbi:TPA: replication-relaxation family protein [Bacillus cereus]